MMLLVKAALGLGGTIVLAGAYAMREGVIRIDVGEELKKYPDADFVEIVDFNEHVRVRTHDGKLQIDVDAPDEKVHVLCPLSTIEDVTSQLEEHSPAP